MIFFAIDVTRNFQKMTQLPILILFENNKYYFFNYIKKVAFLCKICYNINSYLSRMLRFYKILIKNFNKKGKIAMNKAQEIRKRRVLKSNYDVYVEAKEVFDWILDLIDNDTTKRLFEAGPFKIYSTPWDTCIRNFSDEKIYELGASFIKQHGIETFFSILKERIENEPGFQATINLNDFHQECDCISLTITIE